jgi:hypothetical protein
MATMELVPPVPHSLEALRAARAVIMKSLQQVDSAIGMIESFDPTINPREYLGMKPAIALADYLSKLGRSATKKELADALVARGCRLGGRSESNLKTIVTRNPRYFAQRGDRVFLLQDIHNLAA